MWLIRDGNSGVLFYFIAAHAAYASTKLLRPNRLNRDGRASFLRACLDAMLLPQSYWYTDLSERADRVGEQLRGDKDRVLLPWLSLIHI